VDRCEARVYGAQVGSLWDADVYGEKIKLGTV
jgi:hypothetical protein